MSCCREAKGKTTFSVAWIGFTLKIPYRHLGVDTTSSKYSTWGIRLEIVFGWGVRLSKPLSELAVFRPKHVFFPHPVPYHFCLFKLQWQNVSPVFLTRRQDIRWSDPTSETNVVKIPAHLQIKTAQKPYPSGQGGEGRGPEFETPPPQPNEWCAYRKPYTKEIKIENACVRGLSRCYVYLAIAIKARGFEGTPFFLGIKVAFTGTKSIIKHYPFL